MGMMMVEGDACFVFLKDKVALKKMAKSHQVKCPLIVFAVLDFII